VNKKDFAFLTQPGFTKGAKIMPRPLRIEFPDTCHHVICRGNARLPIFEANQDKDLLLDRMVHFAELFRIEIRAYCVMINHVHIHLRTRKANLGAFMRSFLTSFTSMYNHRHNSCGHVFQGRYKAYRHFVESRLLGDITDPMAETAARAVLGSERFTDRFRRGLNDLRENIEVRRESSQHRKLASWVSLKQVMSAVGKAYRCRKDRLLRRHNRDCEARQALLYLAATHCRGRYSLAELGKRFGPVSLSAVSNARTKMAKRMMTDPDLKKRINGISSLLKHINIKT
jgi:REP element-mobilizing transposase RayT